MKKLLIEITVILTITLISSVIFNYFSTGELHLLSKYNKINLKKEKIDFEILDIELFDYYKNEKGVIVLDARSKEEYDQGHIPGAYSFGLNNFEKLFKERGEFLRLGKIIITYCSGEYCNDSYDLAVKLAEKGIGEIFIFKGGMQIWEESGYPVISSAPIGRGYLE